MSQKPKKKARKLPDDITERPDREVMEELFGKRFVKELDKIRPPTTVEPKEK